MGTCPAPGDGGLSESVCQASFPALLGGRCWAGGHRVPHNTTRYDTIRDTWHALPIISPCSDSVVIYVVRQSYDV